MTIQPKMTLELHAYQNFVANYKEGACGTQRFGQAFHDFFKLEKMNNTHLANAIYNADDVTAKELIKENFNIE